jgi:hypothetical protein
MLLFTSPLWGGENFERSEEFFGWGDLSAHAAPTRKMLRIFDLPTRGR